MQTISTLFEGYKLKAVRSHRTEYGDQLDAFLFHINPSRQKAGYKPLSHAGLATCLSRAHVKPEEMYTFYKACALAKDFSKFFWYSLKKKKELSTGTHLQAK